MYPRRKAIDHWRLWQQLVISSNVVFVLLFLLGIGLIYFAPPPPPPDGEQWFLFSEQAQYGFLVLFINAVPAIIVLISDILYLKATRLAKPQFILIIISSLCSSVYFTVIGYACIRSIFDEWSRWL